MWEVRSLTVLAAVVLVGCVDSPRADDQVLVPGDPPLTKDLVDQNRDCAEWLLDICLNAEQRGQYEQLYVKDWNKKDKATKQKELENYGKIRQWWDQLQRMKPDARESAGKGRVHLRYAARPFQVGHRPV